MPNAVEVTPIGAAEFAALMLPFGPYPPLIAVGCSGGPDSLALTRLVDAWARTRGGAVLALIVEHGLRLESAAEARVLGEGLARAGIVSRILRLALAPGPALQERARTARRAALLAACREAGALHLLLGHHAEDQAETVLFRALRGSGPRGLAGMAPLSVAADALILRPLLGMPRARLAATLRGWSIAPLLDPSNVDPRFARARLRAAETQAEATTAPAVPAFARRRARMAAEDTARVIAAIRLLPEGCAAIDPAALGQDAVARRVMAALIRTVSGVGHAPPQVAVAGLLARGSGTLGGAAWLRGGRWLVREAAAIRDGSMPWDGRFRAIVPLPEGMALSALGVDAGRFRGRARHLPAAALAALPALRRVADGTLVLVPHLAYRHPDMAEQFPLIFAPLSGPLTECHASM